MKHDGEAGKTLGDLLQHVKAQGRGNQDSLLVAGALVGSKLVGAVAGADGDGQGVTAGLGHELFHFLGTGVGGVGGVHLYIVLHTGQGAQLGLHDHTVVMGVLNDLLGDLDILLEGLGGGIDHNGGKAAVNAALAGLKVGAVVQMEHNGDLGALDHGGLHQLDQVGVVGIGAGALGNLEDHGSLFFLTGLGNALDDLHVVDVEGADGVAARIGLLEHFGGCNERHGTTTPFLKN